jgi:hypothetical protein
MKFKDNLATSIAAMKFVHQIILPHTFPKSLIDQSLSDIEAFFNTYTSEWEALVMTVSNANNKIFSIGKNNAIAITIQSNQEVDQVLFKLATSCVIETVNRARYNQEASNYNRLMGVI